MSETLLIQLGRESLMMILLISAPILGIGLFVGIAVSIFQATTQIQEPTLAFIPKIVSVFVAIAIFGPWMLRMITQFTNNLFAQLPNLIK
jgi:flagellar biosynthesis protein FliQ